VYIIFGDGTEPVGAGFVLIAGVSIFGDKTLGFCPVGGIVEAGLLGTFAACA
jgi:hypothetical protein